MASPLHLATIMGTLRRKSRCPHCHRVKPAQARLCTYCGKKNSNSQQVSEPGKRNWAWLDFLRKRFDL